MGPKTPSPAGRDPQALGRTPARGRGEEHWWNPAGSVMLLAPSERRLGGLFGGQTFAAVAAGAFVCGDPTESRLRRLLPRRPFGGASRAQRLYGMQKWNLPET